MHTPYGGYNMLALFVYGWGVILIGITGAILMSKRTWQSDIKFKNE